MTKWTCHVDCNVTFYGFDDNDDGEGHYGTATIAHPKLHKIATEDKGSFSHPSTFATAEAFIPPGTKIYVPRLQKYYIMEDGCRSCERDWEKGIKHVDLFIGPNTHSGGQPLIIRENDLTLDGPEIIIVNPPSDLPVSTEHLF